MENGTEKKTPGWDVKIFPYDEKNYTNQLDVSSLESIGEHVKEKLIFGHRSLLGSLPYFLDLSSPQLLILFGTWFLAFDLGLNTDWSLGLNFSVP